MKYIIDLDGTLMNGDKANKDSVSFIDELQKQNSDFIIMTNSVKAPEVINKRLQNVGININVSQIMNPISAVNSYVKSKNYKKAFIIGSENEIRQVSIKEDKENPEIIILLDFEKDNIAFSELQKIFEFIQKGISVISASGSTYYLKNKRQILDTGAFVKLFESVADISIEILGKPSELYFNSAIKLLNTVPDKVTVIGDDWSTDISGANKAGCNSILIRSGKYKHGDELKCKLNKCIDNFVEIFK